MEGTARIWFTPQQRAELWERWKNGQCVADIARALERRNKSGVYRILALNGGIAPEPRQARRCHCLTMQGCEERYQAQQGRRRSIKQEGGLPPRGAARICAGSMSTRPQVASLLRERKADRGLFVGGNHEATTHYSFNGGTDSYCSSIAHKFGSGLAFARPRMARGCGRGSGSR